ncbi:MAG: putative transposase [Myxococcota bacterium]|jgi:putative transposase
MAEAGEPARARRDRQLAVQIRAYHEASRGTYGSPRIHRELTEAGGRVGTKRVARVMREHGLSGPRPRRFRKTTDSEHDNAIADDLVKRDVAPVAPNTVWAADITDIRTWAGWLYLAVVTDLFSRRVVGWAIADHMRTELVLTALERAVEDRRPAAGLVHHSDRGSQHRSRASSGSGRSWHASQHEPEG